MKRAPLIRRTPLHPGEYRLKRTPLKKRSKKGAKREREWAKVRKVVKERAGDKCEVPGCGRLAVHAHHKRLRSQGGADVPENLLAMCLEHHDQTHRRPAEAAVAGLIVMNKETEPQDAERWDGLS
jgi:hypothetical protein